MKDRTPIVCDRCRAEGYLGEGAFRAMKPVLDFEPVPRQCKRHDGWTPDRQRGFIEALARTGSVSRAADAVNMAKEGAYQLRLHPEAGPFRRAWAVALDYGIRILADAALDRAIHGVPVPIMYHGEQVAERRHFNERLTIFHLQHRMAGEFGNAPRIGRGTRHPDTLAREAEALEDDDEREARDEASRRDIERMLLHYSNRVQLEREHRRAGEIEDADFYSRQLTHIELLLEHGGVARELIDMVEGVSDPARPWTMSTGVSIVRSPLTDLLQTMRAEAWRRIEAGEDGVRLPPSLG